MIIQSSRPYSTPISPISTFSFQNIVTGNTETTKPEESSDANDSLRDLDTSDTISNFHFARPDNDRGGTFDVSGRQVPQFVQNQQRPGLAVPNIQQNHAGPGTQGGNMPQIVGIDVQCSKESMLVRVRFNVPFNGVIYAKVNIYQRISLWPSFSPNPLHPKNSIGTQHLEFSLFPENIANVHFFCIFKNSHPLKN